MNTREFLIADINSKIIIEETTRKDILKYIDEHLNNIAYRIDMDEYSFKILYKDGVEDGVEDGVVGNDYDGHKIKRINISAIIVDNPCTIIAFGEYQISKYGVVNPAFKMDFDENIREIH